MYYFLVEIEFLKENCYQSKRKVFDRDLEINQVIWSKEWLRTGRNKMQLTVYRLVTCKSRKAA